MSSWLVVSNAVKSIDVDRLRANCFIYSTPLELWGCGWRFTTDFIGGYSDLIPCGVILTNMMINKTHGTTLGLTKNQLTIFVNL